MSASPPSAQPTIDIPYVERLIAAHPNDTNVWSALGALLRQAGKPDAAAACQWRALELAPGNANALTNLGNVLTDLGRVDDAAAVQEEAVRLSGGAAAPLFNYVIALRQSRQFTKAIELLNGMIEREPENANLRWERALNRLQLGDYEGGLHDYEARRGLAAYRTRPLPGPQWNGEPLKGRTLFVSTEQGFGDTLMAARFLPALAPLGARVIFECHPELRRLLEGVAGVDAMVPAGGELPPYDFHCSQMTLPLRQGITSATLPGPMPINISAASREKAARLVGPPDGTVKVGIIWSGRVTFGDNARRATALKRFLRLLEVPRVRLYAIQKGPPEADLEQLGTSTLITPLGPHFDDFSDTAAVLERLDLVVMTDSSVAHLAGSMGRPVWNLLQYVPYWVYGAEGPTTPWYPSMRLFRQSTPDDWDGVFDDVVAALREFVAARSVTP